MRRFRRRRSVKGSKAAASTEEIVAEVEDEPAEDEDEDLEAELAEFKKTRWTLSFLKKSSLPKRDSNVTEYTLGTIKPKIRVSSPTFFLSAFQLTLPISHFHADYLTSRADGLNYLSNPPTEGQGVMMKRPE